ncbi:hypothetical protein EV183_002928 [Coemansia sp. RSA 2336]|nr:hypothetical protein EV183_002928 [Coemansia sp. RSA 2336]
MSVVSLAGLLIYRVSAGRPIEYLLLNDTFKGHRHWCPPKGKRVGEEDELRCAVRETADLTGVGAGDVETDEAFRAEVRYVDGIRPKQVVYFLGQLVGGQATGTSAGMKQQWYSLEQALERVVFQSMQNILTQAERYIADTRRKSEWRLRATESSTRANDNPRYKTKLCEKFSQEGSCPYGHKCVFAHGQDELRVREQAPRVKQNANPLYKTRLCQRFTEQGACPYGERCQFAHGDEELRAHVAEAAQPEPAQSESANWRQGMRNARPKPLPESVSPETSDNEKPPAAAPIATPVAQKIPATNNAKAHKKGGEKPWIHVVEVTGNDLRAMGSPSPKRSAGSSRTAELENRLARELAAVQAQKPSQQQLLREITHMEFRNNLTKQQLLNVVVAGLFSDPTDVTGAITQHSGLLARLAGKSSDQPLLLNAWARVLRDAAWQRRATDVLSALYTTSLLDEDTFTQWFEARSGAGCSTAVAAMRPFARWLATAEEE